MDTFATEFSTLVASLNGKTSAPNFNIDDENTKDVINQIHSSLQNHTNDNIKEYIPFLNYAIGRYSLTLHASYSNADKSVDSWQDSHVICLFILLDLSIILESTILETDSFAMHTFVTLLSYTYPIDMIIDRFAPIFFENDSNSFDRRRLLTRNFNLQGKVKPGSRLLVLYKQMIERIPQFEYNNLKVASQFRNFIVESFSIDDKLSQGLDWHLIGAENGGGYIGSFSQYSKEMKLIPENIYQSGGRKFNRSIFQDYIALMNHLTTSNIGEWIRSINRLTPRMGGRVSESPLMLLDALNTELRERQFHIKKSRLNEQTNKMYKWVMNESQFNEQLTTYDLYWALKLQIYIILNFLRQMKFSNWTAICDDVAKEYSKFRKPEFLVNSITSPEGERRLNSWIADIEKEFQKKYPQNNAIQHLFQINEASFTKMKLKSFTNPLAESVDVNANIESRKRKLQEYTENFNTETFLKKSKYPHVMGTPKLSKLWKTSTQQKMEIFRSYDDVLESVRDDMYFVRGTKEESPDDADNNEKFSRLAWKGLRSVRETGGWLKSVTRGCNEDGQCENDTTVF